MTAVRRGLADRAPTVRSAAVDMLTRWLEAFEGDVLGLMGALDAESHEDVAASVVRELIAVGKIKPVETAASVAEGNPPGGGLRRDVSAAAHDAAALMTPESAVFWRVVGR